MSGKRLWKLINFQNCLTEGLKYNEGDRARALAEFNAHADALEQIPGGITNEFINEHTLPSGLIDVVGLACVRYGVTLPKADFVALYRGRYTERGSGSYELRGYLYSFADGQLQSVDMV